MANIRINIFENYPLKYDVAYSRLAQNALNIMHVYFPGSISFNNVAALMSQNHTSASASVSFGLYSLNGSTLSLANSASAVQPGANGLSWITFATSATQDVTPGDWYFAVILSTNGQNSISLANANQEQAGLEVDWGGPFFRGDFTATTEALPASIATSDMDLEGSSTTPSQQTYILISA